MTRFVNDRMHRVRKTVMCYKEVRDFTGLSISKIDKIRWITEFCLK